MHWELDWQESLNKIKNANQRNISIECLGKQIPVSKEIKLLGVTLDKSVRKIQYQTKLEKQVKVNSAMAECCHHRHGNAAESEIKNEFETKLATRASILQP